MQIETDRLTWREFEEKVNSWCDCIEKKSKEKGKEVFLWFKECKKYYKILLVFRGNEKTYAFVDKKTGNIYKPKSKSAPFIDKTKYNLFKDHKNLLSDCNQNNSYLIK